MVNPLINRRQRRARIDSASAVTPPPFAFVSRTATLTPGTLDPIVYSFNQPVASYTPQVERQYQTAGGSTSTNVPGVLSYSGNQVTFTPDNPWGEGDALTSNPQTATAASGETVYVPQKFHEATSFATANLTRHEQVGGGALTAGTTKAIELDFDAPMAGIDPFSLGVFAVDDLGVTYSGFLRRRNPGDWRNWEFEPANPWTAGRSYYVNYSNMVRYAERSPVNYVQPAFIPAA